jgi:hypothetical protein
MDRAVTLRRLAYVLWRILETLVSVASRTFNALALGGSTHQTTSARMHIEDWPRGKWIINAVFFWEDDHCQKAWEMEVRSARRTLELSEP